MRVRAAIFPGPPASDWRRRLALPWRRHSSQAPRPMGVCAL